MTSPPPGSKQLEQRHAEVISVWPREGHVSVHGIIHGIDHEPEGTPDNGEKLGTWRALLLLRGRPDVTRTYTLELEPVQGEFDIVLPIGDLVPPGEYDRQYWDLYLATGTGEDETRLRVGRHLDDIQDKKRVMKFPGQRTSGNAGDVRVAPYYTDHNNLSIRARRLRPSEATA